MLLLSGIFDVEFSACLVIYTADLKTPIFHSFRHEFNNKVENEIK